MRTRNNLLKQEADNTLGGKIILNEEEQKANSILMKMKEKEMKKAFNNPNNFNLSRHYFHHRDQIEESEVYQIIQRMPKGAALHVHGTFVLGADELLNLTYEDHLYACYSPDKSLVQLLFSYTMPRPYGQECQLLSDLRDASDNVDEFDFNLKKYFSIGQYTDTDIDTVWQKFNDAYYIIKRLISYRPVREKFIYQSLKKFYDDNVMYVEIRSGTHLLYELDGTIHDARYLFKLYERITKKFMEEYPDFVGIKWILTRHRTISDLELRETLHSAIRYKKEFPDLFAGFDLVGQEDKGRPLKDLLPALIEAKEDLNYYFHGGETNWFGTTTDENLFDAVLLGSKRIGHAYALLKHPTLLAAVYKNDIAIEVNVISNAVLALVTDVRNHPLASYLALGLPVVLSSDDPGVWGAEPLSHDFYVTFVAVASRHADLHLLKQLAINSIKYSALNDTGKEELYHVFSKRWRWFVRDIIASNG